MNARWEEWVWRDTGVGSKHQVGSAEDEDWIGEVSLESIVKCMSK